MNAVQRFNGLNGATVSRNEVRDLIRQALDQDQPHLARRLQAVLDNHDHKNFRLCIESPEIEAAPPAMLSCIDCASDEDDSANGLAKAVSPTEIYDMITQKVIDALEKPLKFKQEWGSLENFEGGYLIAYNFDSKKPYRGANAFLLNSLKLYDPEMPLLRNPYYMTFKQVEAHGGTVRKGSQGLPVVYFTNLYKIDLAAREIHFASYDKAKAQQFATSHGIDHNLIADIPILKYYNVFNGADVDGIDFDLENFPFRGQVAPVKAIELKKVEPIPVAEAIIGAYPKPAPKINFGGDEAYFRPAGDMVQMRKIEQFKYVQAYYTTFFHELIHSTGSKDRLARTFGKKFGDKDYSFEELVAELGASFLSAEAGMLHYTFRNSAAYIKGWRNRLLTILRDDNRFFFRAAAQAQKAVDFMLDRDPDGKAAYEKKFKHETILPAVPKKSRKAKRPQKPAKDRIETANPKGHTVKPKSVSVKTAIDDVLSLSKYNGIGPLTASLVYKRADITKVDPDDGSGEFQIESPYEIGILSKESPLHWFYTHKNELQLKPLGIDFINSVAGRLESLRNQKHNIALFDGLKLPAVAAKTEPEPAPIEQKPKIAPVQKPIQVKEQAPLSTNPRVRKIGQHSDRQAQYFKVAGEPGRFLQRIERKPKESVVITLDGEQGAGKTTTLYKFMDAFAAPGNRSLFLSLEEHPDSDLARQKVTKHLSSPAIASIDIVGEVDSVTELYQMIAPYEIIFIDSWQKLLRMIGQIRLDEDLRKRFDGKVFVIIFQQTTTGRTKGGAEVVFDGDLIIKMVKAGSFSENYAWFDKHRYTLVPLEDIRYNIASGTVYNPNQTGIQEPENKDIGQWAIQIQEK